MWYDKYPGVPPRGSPLEAVFLLMHIHRREAELLATRSMVHAQWALLSKSEEWAKKAFEAYQTYAESMFPFLERAANTTTTDQARLLELVKYPMRIDVASVEKQRAQKAKALGLKKFQARTR